jgi:hypothetical protein
MNANFTDPSNAIIIGCLFAYSLIVAKFTGAKDDDDFIQIMLNMPLKTIMLMRAAIYAIVGFLILAAALKAANFLL